MSLLRELRERQIAGENTTHTNTNWTMAALNPHLPGRKSDAIITQFFDEVAGAAVLKGSNRLLRCKCCGDTKTRPVTEHKKHLVGLGVPLCGQSLIKITSKERGAILGSFNPSSDAGKKELKEALQGYFAVTSEMPKNGLRMTGTFKVL